MRTSESVNEAEWKKLCVKGIGTIKRLKRKNREVIRHRGILQKVCRGEEERLPDPLIARLSGSSAAWQQAAGGSRGPGAAEGVPSAGEAAPLSPPGSAAPGRRKFPRPPGEPPALAEQPSLLQPRILLCPRPSEGAYPAHHPQPTYSPSPRKRPADSAGVSTEIRAIQQTRRLLANARERTRVHTISAAFEALRKQVPCYSYGQKLSKLAILRIACNYILSLATLADLDYSSDHSNMSFSECVEQCTKTLQAEGRSKKRKE
ncbi:hypothetical protein scyTo_0011776 [Scyliorhinus torazame]|uniref:Protein atonal homolog 8 n=2 Tax=Scyliorhinus torazame TaxID=75743 RepID=A0A401NUU5_SCYTO|nr:hypothetical protein [Scyliorhinus torazame]